MYESIFVVLIYWEICLRTDFQSRQTLYTLLCRTCATLSSKAVVSWHPHHCSCHDNKNPYFYVFFPLIKRHNLTAIAEPKSRYYSTYFMYEFSFLLPYLQRQKHPYQAVLPRVTQTLARGRDEPRAISRRVSGALPAGERLLLGSSAAASFCSAAQAPRLCSFDPRFQVGCDNSPRRALLSHRCPNPFGGHLRFASC